MLGLAALAVAMVVTGIVVASAIRDVKARRDTITVTGSARFPIMADFASWHLSATATAFDPRTAARQLARETRTVRAFLADGGLTGSDVSVPPIVAYEVLLRVPGQRTRRPGYRLTQPFTVRSRKVAAVESVASNVSTLFERGLPVSVSRISYVSTQLSVARRRALERATADAKRRAATIVSGLNGDLGGVRRASLGVYQIVPRHSTAVSDYGINDTSAREKDVIAVVTITFAVS